jgi:hypothetical protein
MLRVTELQQFLQRGYIIELSILLYGLGYLSICTVYLFL